MHIKEYKNVEYGPYDRNVLDAYIVDLGGRPSPVLVYFHGGGYLAGDKAEILSMPLMRDCLDAGISVISCNYRFISKDPFPAPMDDGTRAIRFVRHMADDWALDREKLASSGSSAGGHIALWNALKGNQAKPDSADPWERIPTDVSGFIGFGTQVSKDQRFYEGIYEGPHIQPNLALFYGIPTIDELYRPEILKLAEQASAIHYMSPAAPPVFMVYRFELDMNNPHIPADAPVGEVIHHPMHGYVLKKKYDELDKPFILRHNGDPVRAGEMVRFLTDCFGL